MKIHFNGESHKVQDAMSIYDDDACKFRMAVYEEDGVLRVIFCEPVIIVTEKEDLTGARHKPH